MQTNVVQTVFPRTDFGSFGWIDKVEGDLWEVWFFQGVDALTKVFRVGERGKLSPLLTDFGSFGWIDKVPGNLWDVAYFQPVDVLMRSSFRAGERPEMPFLRPDFGSFGWIDKVPGDLWEVPFFSGVKDLTNSFRLKERTGLLSSQFHLTEHIFQWITGLGVAAALPKDYILWITVYQEEEL